MSLSVSFRDPAGFCLALNGHILRVVDPAHVAALEGFLNSDCAQKFTAAGNLISSRLLTKTEMAQWLEHTEFKDAVAGRQIGAGFEHERIDFPSFPHEWTAPMLFIAPELTLALAI